MASLASPRRDPTPPEPPAKLRLTFAKSMQRISVGGVWSNGPVYRRLDSDFLAQPQIPKAPPTPRMQIDRVNGSLRVIDTLAQPGARDPAWVDSAVEGPIRTPVAPTLRTVSRRRAMRDRKMQRWLQGAALAIGFAAGLAVALLLRLL